jgi:hypothetical protein
VTVWRGHRPSPPANGAFTLEELRSVALDVPEFGGCGGSGIKFAGGTNEPAHDGRFSPTTITMVDAATGDLYGEGRTTTALLMSCGSGGSGTSYADLVVTIDRGVDGAPLVRDIVVSASQARVYLAAVRIAAPATVDIQFVFPNQVSPSQRERQWRTFGVRGTGFEQTAGPTSFASHPIATELIISGTPLRLNATADSGYRGDTTVTIHNAGVNPVAQAYVIAQPS